jgi:hypothetical protein
MLDLNAHLEPNSGQGWVLHWASGINGADQVVGVGTLYGSPCAYKLTPAELTPAEHGPGIPGTTHDPGGWSRFQRILFAVIQGGGGLVLTPKGPRPVPPSGPLADAEWEQLGADERDVIVAILLLQAADGLSDESTRREQRQSAGVMLGRALERLRNRVEPGSVMDALRRRTRI